MNSRFFYPASSFTLSDILKHIGVDISSIVKVDGQSNDAVLTTTADLATARSGNISFISNIKFKKDAEETNASVVFACEKTKDLFKDNVIVVVVKNAQEAYALTKQMFYPKPTSIGIVSDNASVDSSAIIGKNVELRSGVCIRSGACIADNVVLCENVIIGEKVAIGTGTVVGANTVIEYATIGTNCQIHSNVTIGSRGFGFIPKMDKHIDIMQTGSVVIGNDVEIGAGTCIDRGAEKDTILCDNVRLDNLVHIAHNAFIGKGSVLAGQVGFAGSVTIGQGVMFGGQSGVSPGVTIGDRAVVMGRSGVARDMPADAVYAGFPARPYKEWLKENIKRNKKENKDD